LDFITQMYRDVRTKKHLKKYRIALAAIRENPVQYFHKWIKDGTIEEIVCRI